MSDNGNSNRRRLVSFASIGIANTLIDVTIFLSLRQLLVPILAANIVSTSVALSFSFLMNKRFTFGSSNAIKKSLPAFILVTLVGLWVLQPIIIKLVLTMLYLPAVDMLLQTVIFNADRYYELLAKLAATPATLIWNFLLYKRVVFKNNILIKK